MIKTAPDIDYAPLHEPLTPADIAQYKQKFEEPENQLVTVVTWVVIFGILGYISIAIGNVIGTASSPPAGIIAGLVFFVLTGAFAWFGFRWINKESTERHACSYKFALRNDAIYTPTSGYIESQTGMIFDNGDKGPLTDIFQLKVGNVPVEIGNYAYETGSGKSRREHKYGYMRVTLQRHLPHMVLDSKANNFSAFGLTLSNGLSDRFKHDQVLSLEGDFDKYFTLYCPKQYERDALYVFTPDLMALLIDEVESYDVEIVDNDMYVYQNQHFPVNDEETFRRLVQIAHVVGWKADDRTDYYADERIGDRTQDVVAVPGKRLKQGLPWITFIVVAIYILYQFISLLWVGNSSP